MKNCLIIINNAAGKSKRISFEKVEKCLGQNFAYTHFSLPEDGEYTLNGYDAVAVCGGDGTLGSLLSKAYDKHIDVYYFPVGTLNDRAGAKRYEHAKTKCPSCADTPTKGKRIAVGKFSPDRFETRAESEYPNVDQHSKSMDNTADLHYESEDGNTVARHESADGIFSYVLAAGSFTPIGYMADVGLKKKLGVLAYIFQILKQYRVHRIPAEIRCGTKRFEGDFTLIMALRSPRCFGFHFNRAFDAESASGHLVAIRSPKHDGIWGAIEMFFPFFRVFFMGLKKEKEGRIIFKKIYSCDITCYDEVAYCRDGEKYVAPAGTLKINIVRAECDLSVIEKF